MLNPHFEVQSSDPHFQGLSSDPHIEGLKSSDPHIEGLSYVASGGGSEDVQCMLSVSVAFMSHLPALRACFGRTGSDVDAATGGRTRD